MIKNIELLLTVSYDSDDDIELIKQTAKEIRAIMIKNFGSVSGNMKIDVIKRSDKPVPVTITLHCYKDD